MTTNWQPPPSNTGRSPGPNNQPIPKQRIGLIAILLIVIAGLATSAGLVLVNRGGEDLADQAQFVTTDIVSTQPVFEPASAAGNDPFYPLGEQVITFRAEAENEIQRRVAEIRAEAEPGEDVSVPVFNVQELEENIKNGLYGGTAENTCDPERLIAFLIANPHIGEAWAAVQGISFNQIPEYIRSLDVQVLAADLEVINHGYDPVTQTAYPIVSVLEAGTAVLVDADGEVRTRCYCGNPILPKPPTTYMPPRCIIVGHAVHVNPGGGATRDDAPRDVLLTGRQTTLASGGTWVEVTWGAGDDQTGWVRNDSLRRHYCPPPREDYECPGPGEVPVYANDHTTVVGFLNGTLNLHDGPADIFAPIDPVGGPGGETIVDGFLLIHFERVGPSNSAWVKTEDLNQDPGECHYITQCVQITNPVRERPGGVALGGGFVGGPQYIDYTGKFAPELRQFTEIRLLDHGSVEGWVAPFWVTNLDPAECDDKVHYNCVEDGTFYRTPTEGGGDHYGHLSNAEVIVIDPAPDNGRILIDVAPGGPQAWIDQGDLQGGWNECKPVPECYNTTGPAHAIYHDAGAVLAADATPRILNLVGKTVDEDAPDVPDAYERIEDPDTGLRYWIKTGLGGHLQALPAADCEPTPPECPRPGDPREEDRNAVALNVQGPLRFGVIVNPDADTRPPTNPDRPGGFNTECCVNALFQNKDLLGPASARSVPREVTLGSFDGTWYTTNFGDHFQDIHVVGAVECRPRCPEVEDRNPGGVEGVDDDIASYIAETVVFNPDGKNVGPIPIPGNSPSCCVDALYAAPGVGGNLITEPTYVAVNGGPDYQFLDDWYSETGGNWFPSAARVDNSECDQDISCPDLTNDGFPGTDYFDDTKALAKSIYAPGDVDTCCIGGYIGYAGPYEAQPATAVDVIPGTFVEVVVVDATDDGLWFELDNGFWVSADSFVDPALCDEPPECPDGSVLFAASAPDLLCCIDGDNGPEFILLSDMTGSETFLPVDDCEYVPGECPEDSLTFPAPSPVSLAITNHCCVDGDNGPERIHVDDLIGSETFLPASDCEDVNVECPAFSITKAGQCCVTGKPGTEGEGERLIIDGGDGIDPTLFDPIAAEDCRIGECPRVDTFSDNDPEGPTSNTDPNNELLCCVEITPGSFIEVELTGERERLGPGLWLYETVNNGWRERESFVDANLCEQDDPAVPPQQPQPPQPPAPVDPCANQGGDSDGDGVCDNRDNCRQTDNPNQADTDGDGIGDACDEPETDRCLFFGGDSDGDGVCEEEDNCPNDPNRRQADDDNDGRGNECDPTPQGNQCEDRRGDTDEDGVCDIDDNCRLIANPSQLDSDGDKIGDACDQFDPCETSGGDIDNDGICDDQDECTAPDADGDGREDDCDSCPGLYNPEQFPLPYQDGTSCTPGFAAPSGLIDTSSTTGSVPAG